ncbi:hypothetical protein FWG95_01465 [Candidatus Saccharibacteria bacterium]|nr:hypothetical protein [Candidatus Saccharibacteria bacterium]
MNKLNKVLAVASVTTMAFVGMAVAVPAANAATDFKTDTVSLTIGETLMLTLTGTGDFGTVSVASANTAAQNANVKSNFVGGYVLILNDQDTDTDLVGTTSSSNTIPTLASASTLLPNQSTSAWGVYVGTGTTGAAGSTFQPMPSSAGTPIQIASTSAISAAAGDNYPVTYGAQISGSQAPDIYEDIVVYTLTSN